MTMTTLCIETSTPRGSVALFSEAGALLFSEAFEAGRNHSAQLFGVLERALAGQAGVRQIVVGLGPGSYAGTRIAISAAVGYSAATGASLVGLPSVVALAEGNYVAIGDARRESFSWTVVRGGEAVEGPLLVPADAIAPRLAWAAAEGLPLYASEALPTIDTMTAYPCAKRLGRLALLGHSIVAREALEPIYLREPHITAPKAK
jgi:tRNA threonylcarbamoyladenosine biosynthesis protein TsaB